MKRRSRRIAIGAAMAVVLAIGMSSPGLAQAATAIPEPGDVSLLALAVAGLVIGRQVAKRRRHD